VRIQLENAGFKDKSMKSLRKYGGGERNCGAGSTEERIKSYAIHKQKTGAKEFENEREEKVNDAKGERHKDGNRKKE